MKIDSRKLGYVLAAAALAVALTLLAMGREPGIGA
jgi:hypothetical protein